MFESSCSILLLKFWNKGSNVISVISISFLYCFQVHYILNELVMGGMVLETNMTEILLRIEEQSKIEKEEVIKKMTSHIKKLNCYGMCK
jgi:hypothetical protein